MLKYAVARTIAQIQFDDTAKAVGNTKCFRVINRVILILISHFVRDTSTCFLSVCTSPAKAAFQSPRVAAD